MARKKGRRRHLTAAHKAAISRGVRRAKRRGRKGRKSHKGRRR